MTGRIDLLCADLFLRPQLFLAAARRTIHCEDMWSALNRDCALETALRLVPQIIPQEALELSQALEGKIRSHFE